MSYLITIKKSSKKEISKLSKKIQLQIIEAIRVLSNVDNNLDIKPIKNMPNTYRLRVGNYRVLFYQDDEEKCITIWRVSHRSTAYRDL